MLSKFGNKWSVLTLLILEQNGAIRFNELSKAIPDVSQKMLTVTLRNLENLNLIKRKIYPEVPPCVEYTLSELGASLLEPMHSMIDWALEHKDECLKKLC